MSFGNEREFIDYLQRKEGKTMKCPLIREWVMTQPDVWEPIMADCLKEECAWWSKSIEACSLLGLETSLSLIGALLLEIKDKMPHELQFRK